MSAGPTPYDPEVEASDLTAGTVTLAELIATRWDILLAIGAGGALGSLARWEIARLWPPLPGGFPSATFTANVLGSLIIGLLITTVLDRHPTHRFARPFLAVGVLGGFTTFSAYALDTRNLFADGTPGLALGYAFVTLVAGLAAASAGLAIGRRLWPHR